MNDAREYYLEFYVNFPDEYQDQFKDLINGLCNELEIKKCGSCKYHKDCCIQDSASNLFGRTMNMADFGCAKHEEARVGYH